MSLSDSKPRAVFFDMDGTLTPCNTGRIYAHSLWKEGKLSTVQLLGVLGALVRYRMGLIRLERLMKKWIEQSAGESENEAVERCVKLAHEQVIPSIFAEARDAVDSHRNAGDLVAILSASSSYIIHPVARELRIDHVLATPLHVQNGVFTGGFDEPICYGEGKVEWAKRFCEQHGFSVEESVFYTDSFTDVPLLRRVGTPVVINPDFRLGREAKKRDWVIHIWGQ